MINALHICGVFPLPVFIEATGIRLAKAHKIVVERVDAVLYITFMDDLPIYGYETYSYEYDLRNLSAVFVESVHSHVVFTGASFADTASLEIVGCNNVLEFWNCAITDLYITTSSVNTLNFERQPLMGSVSAKLCNTLVTGLKVRGGEVNNIDAHNNSAVELSVGLAKGHRRAFDFHKDDSSMISVVCSKRGSREVIEDRELWLISDGLDSIVNPRVQEVS